MCFTACAQKDGKKHTEASGILIAYFSATGTTAKAARTLSEITGGKLYEITPQKAYSSADLNWHDTQSRSSLEMNNADARPALKDTMPDISKYDTIFIGYPIWWDQAPRIINTFIESLSLKGKTLVPFATSGGSGIENSVRMLQKTYPGLEWKNGKLLNRTGRKGMEEWINGIRPAER